MTIYSKGVITVKTAVQASQTKLNLVLSLLKAAIINIFIITIYQMTVYLRGVARNHDPLDNKSAALLGFMELYSKFQVTLLFFFTLTALLIFSRGTQVF